MKIMKLLYTLTSHVSIYLFPFLSLQQIETKSEGAIIALIFSLVIFYTGFIFVCKLSYIDLKSTSLALNEEKALFLFKYLVSKRFQDKAPFN